MAFERTAATRFAPPEPKELHVSDQEVGGLELLDDAERLQLQADWDDAVAEAWFAEGKNLPPEKQVYAEQQPGSVARYLHTAWDYFRKKIAPQPEHPTAHERRYWFANVNRVFDESLPGEQRQKLIQDMIDRVVTVHGKMYAIERYLGRGAFGLVFRAKAPDDQSVVVKMSKTFDRAHLNRLLPADADRTVYQNATRARSAVTEPAVLHRLKKVTDNRYFPRYIGATLEQNPDRQPGQPDERMAFQVMEYIQGESLDQHLRPNKDFTSAPDYVVQLAGELIDATDQMHQAGVVHLDIKPSNIMMRKGHPLFVDYGTGVLPEKRQPTRTGKKRIWANPSNAMYTLRYVTEAEKNMATAQRDVYALGVTLQDIIYGQPRVLQMDVATYADYKQQRYRDLPRRLQAIARIADQMTLANPEQRWTLAQAKEALRTIDQPTGTFVEEEVA